MDIIKLIFIPALLLLTSAATNAATTITNVKSTAYQYVNTDATLSLDLFTSATFTTSISEAWQWSGDNISEGNPGFKANLNAFFDDNGQAASDFAFTSAVKVSSEFEYPISGPIGGILLKQATSSLLVLFNSPVSDLYWNTEFAGDHQGGLGNVAGKISHYHVIDGTISEVPIPAALWLFGPALLGFLGLRRKQR